MSICHREKGIKISDLDMVCGDVAVHINEDLFLRTDKNLETISDTTATEGARLDILSKTSEKNKSSLSIKKHIFAFPEKVCILYYLFISCLVSLSTHCFLQVLIFPSALNTNAQSNCFVRLLKWLLIDIYRHYSVFLLDT